MKTIILIFVSFILISCNRGKTLKIVVNSIQNNDSNSLNHYEFLKNDIRSIYKLNNNPLAKPVCIGLITNPIKMKHQLANNNANIKKLSYYEVNLTTNAFNYLIHALKKNTSSKNFHLNAKLQFNDKVIHGTIHFNPYKHFKRIYIISNEI